MSVLNEPDEEPQKTPEQIVFEEKMQKFLEGVGSLGDSTLTEYQLSLAAFGTDLHAHYETVGAIHAGTNKWIMLAKKR